MPQTPTLAARPTCVSMGPIGVMLSGSLLFNALDGKGRDAVAHEEQDHCQGPSRPIQRLPLSLPHHLHRRPRHRPLQPARIRARRLRRLRHPWRERQAPHQCRPRRLPRPHPRHYLGWPDRHHVPLPRHQRIPIFHRLLRRHTGKSRARPRPTTQRPARQRTTSQRARKLRPPARLRPSASISVGCPIHRSFIAMSGYSRDARTAFFHPLFELSFRPEAAHLLPQRRNPQLDRRHPLIPILKHSLQ